VVEESLVFTSLVIFYVLKFFSLYKFFFGALLGLSDPSFGISLEVGVATSPSNSASKHKTTH
jgi:hypothetical protein